MRAILSKYLVLFVALVSFTSNSFANQCFGFYGANSSVGKSLSPRIHEAELLLERKLEVQEVEGIWTAHYIGLNEKGADGGPAKLRNFTSSQIARKVAALKKAGFESREIRLLMDKGITGFELFFEVYGIFSFGRDLWRLFTYNPKKTDEFVQQFNAPVENGRVRPPVKAFEDVFRAYLSSHYASPTRAILSESLGNTLKRIVALQGKVDQADRSFYQQNVSKEAKELARAFEKEVAMALLVNGTGGKQELLIGTVEPVAGHLHNFSLTTELRVHTANGVKTIAVADVIKHTNVDLRNRYVVFSETFEVFRPSTLPNLKDSVLALNDINHPDLAFYNKESGKEIELFKSRYLRNEQVAFLVKNIDGNQRLVIGKAAIETEEVKKVFSTVEHVPNPKKGFFQPSHVAEPSQKEKSVKVIKYFVVVTEGGRERILRDDVVAYTRLDLRDRNTLFEKEFREFGIQTGPHQLSGPPSTAEYYTNQLVPVLKRQFDSKTTLAYLVKEKDGAQKLLVGIPEPIKTGANNETAIKIHVANQQPVIVMMKDILALTTESVKSYVGIDMALLQKAFAVMPSQRSAETGLITGKELVIKDTADNTSPKDQLKSATNLPTAQKVSYAQSLIGREMLEHETEALMQALFARAVPLTRAEIEKGIQKPITAEDMEVKKSYLKLGGFNAAEINTIAQSGLMGVVE